MEIFVVVFTAVALPIVVGYYRGENNADPNTPESKIYYKEVK